MTIPAPSLTYTCMPRPVIAHGPHAIAALQPDEIEDVRQWRNAQMDVLRQARPISPAEQTAYFKRAIWPQLASPQPDNILLGYHENGALIGYGGLVHMDWPARSAEVSFLLDPRLPGPISREQDLFIAFLGLVKTLTFKDLALVRLTTETYAIRPAHVRTLEAAGFALERRVQDQAEIDGRQVDSLFHGCNAAPNGQAGT